MSCIIEIAKALKESDLLIKGVHETVKNEVKEQKEELLGMLPARLATSLLGNFLIIKRIIWTGEGAIRAGEKITRVGQDF